MPKYKPKKPFSLYKPGTHFGNMSKTSEFMGEMMRRHIETGSVPVNVYRLKGTFAQNRDALRVKKDTHGSTEDATDIGSFLGIQDTILGENRDRDYDFDEIPVLRGVYTVSQNELEYARFGLGMSNDVITMEFHAKEMERLVGRRLIVGDVVELEHLREVGVDGRVANKWYEVSSITWSPTGYDPLFMRHILGVILKPLRHQQEFLAFFEREDEYGKTLADQASNRDAMLAITEANQQIAGEQAPVTGWDTTVMYFDPNDPERKPYRWFDSATPPNGIPVAKGPNFPSQPADGDWFLRTDLMPNRLYQFHNRRWRLREVDQKREWQPYNWTAKLRQFMSDRSEEDKSRKYELRSIHDVMTDREPRSDPSGNED